MNVVMPDFPDTVRLNSRLKAKFFYKRDDLYMIPRLFIQQANESHFQGSWNHRHRPARDNLENDIPFADAHVR